MSNLTRYGVANMDQLLDRITRNSVGMDEYFDTIFGTAQGNYPPYNLIQESNTRSRLEIALAGFKKDEVNVYTEYGKLVVEARKKIKKRKTLSTKVWLNGHSLVRGQSLMIRKFDQLLLKMGY